MAHYTSLLALDLEPHVREEILTKREEAAIYERACEAWEPHYQRAIEYPASRIFIALREDVLRGKGRLLAHPERTEAFALLEADDRDVFDIAPTDIPPSFWSLRGIDFKASTAWNESEHYCHIAFRTEDMLSAFPGNRVEVRGIERIGGTFVLDEKLSTEDAHSRRGRPPYPWDQFHIEVAGLLQRGELPAKKEAAIEHFQSWFERSLGARPSRAAIGGKLKPYYDRFLK